MPTIPLVSPALIIGLSVLVPALAMGASRPTSSERVGRTGTNRLVTPVNQIVEPLGKQVDLLGLRPQAMALSPDGKLLAVSGKTSEIIILNASSGEIRQRVELPATGQGNSGPVSANILK